MARPKGSKNKSTGRRFKKFEGRWPDDKHLRLTKDMMMDKAFMGLSGNAVRLYLYMKLWAIGQAEIDFSASMVADVMARHTFFKARDELITAGFIDFTNRHCARDKRETGHYVFSDRWQGEFVFKPKKTSGLPSIDSLAAAKIDERMRAREQKEAETATTAIPTTTKGA